MPTLRKINPEKPNLSSTSLDEPRYPGLGLDIKHLPEAKKWEIGHDYFLVMKVRQTSMSQTGEDEGHVGFDIRAIGPTESVEESEDKKESSKGSTAFVNLRRGKELSSSEGTLRT